MTFTVADYTLAVTQPVLNGQPRVGIEPVIFWQEVICSTDWVTSKLVFISHFNVHFQMIVLQALKDMWWAPSKYTLKIDIYRPHLMRQKEKAD